MRASTYALNVVKTANASQAMGRSTSKLPASVTSALDLAYAQQFDDEHAINSVSVSVPERTMRHHPMWALRVRIGKPNEPRKTIIFQ